MLCCGVEKTEFLVSLSSVPCGSVVLDDDDISFVDLYLYMNPYDIFDGFLGLCISLD